MILLDINADFRHRIVVATDHLTWEASPSGTVWRKPLYREGGEYGPVTSLVRYAAGGHFRPHAHPQGEEILVLEGVFSDEQGDYPAGAYLLNPDGSEDAPFSRSGCILFVRLRQYAGSAWPRLRLNTPALAWQPGAAPGVTIKPLYAQTGYPEQIRLAAAYKGLAALLMKHGSRDFIGGTPIDLNTYFNNAIDIHHIFPRAWCESNQLPREKWNSVVNKAPLAASTNRFISGDAPSDYLARIQKSKQVSNHSLDEFLVSHAIPVADLRANNFDGFIRRRASALLRLIEDAMGKAVSGRDSEETMRAFGGTL